MRDDFSEKTKATLSRRAGMRCSNPNCRQPTVGPGDEADGTVNIGVAAHISAASPGGPRYRPALTSEERRSIRNGIWLCQNCAKVIDSDEARFTIALVTSWRSLSEEAARLAVERPGTASEGHGTIAGERLEHSRLLASLFGPLEVYLDAVTQNANSWEARSNLARHSVHQPFDRAAREVSAVLERIERQFRRSRWVLHWRVAALTYAIVLKGQEFLAAIRAVGAETDDWEMKRGHLLAARGLGAVVQKYMEDCNVEFTDSLSDMRMPNGTEQEDFYRQLGDIGRAESQAFAERYPELVEHLRELNREATHSAQRDHLYGLMGDRILKDPSSVELSEEERLQFLEALYAESLGFYFRMWNEPINDATRSATQSRLTDLLLFTSTPAILEAFRAMIAAIENTSATMKRNEAEAAEEFQAAFLSDLRPSARAYHDLERLTNAHLESFQKC